MKTCTKCGLAKPLAEFARRRRAIPGDLQAQCKECRREQKRAWKARNPERDKEHWLRWRAKQPEGTLPYQRRWYEQDPERNREQRRVWKEANRDKVNEAERLRYAANIEVARQRAREYQHRRRGMRGPVSVETMARTLELLDHACTYCGSIEKIEIDHIVPLSRGGTHEPENLAPACRACNRSKGAKLLSEWEAA